MSVEVIRWPMWSIIIISLLTCSGFLVLQETWCSGPCEWLWLGAKWAAWYNPRREGCGGFHFNLAWWIVSRWLCCVLYDNAIVIVRFLGFWHPSLFSVLFSIYYWSIQESYESFCCFLMSVFKFNFWLCVHVFLHFPRWKVD